MAGEARRRWRCLVSRRYASYQPADVIDDEVLLVMLYGTQDRQEQRPMPGCVERCCGGHRNVYAEWSFARLDWQLSGADLLGPLGWVLAALLAIRLVWLAVGGAL